MPGRNSAPLKQHLKGIVILHEDRDLLVVDKPPGLLTIATDREQERTAYHILTDYVRKGSARSRNRIFIVHRLDRETSGILIFAKSEKAKFHLQGGWEETEKRYLAVIHGRLESRAGTITTTLTENRAHRVYSTPDPTQGRLSHTAYDVLKETKLFSLLEVRLLTGRKHQIRVHLAEKGHPVVGDKRYGKEGDGHRRLALHARSISFQHPFSGQRLTFETSIPGYFNELVGNLT
ncbi:MAG: RluA family pseudouridine synthase [Candidatus Latescibacteria bacterium]|nr:RluA family pseudouridine synthase [Candidatus Latescibacterota bacterium]